ncbi:MAG: SdpI family protein [Peptostreptococcus sp.]|uniref:SdpI family protein n=1 Tax=Peptostreptococcus sp. TaxID=1262 RepID=UPI002FC6C701
MSINKKEDRNILRKLTDFLTILPIVVSIVALSFMPDMIAMHYNIDGIADRFASKYEILILPISIIILSIIMKLIERSISNDPVFKNRGKSNQKVIERFRLVLVLMLNVLTFYIIYTSVMGVEDLSKMKINITTLVGMMIALIFIVIGRSLPKTEINNVFGIRTDSSMKNEKTWDLTQKFSARVFIITGVILFIGIPFLRGVKAIVAILLCAIVPSIICIVYAHIIAKKY